MTMTIFDTTISNGDYIAHIDNHDTGHCSEFNFMTYADAYDWAKSLVVLSRGFVTVGIYKNNNRICCITGTDAPWYGNDIISVWTIYKGGTKIRTSEKKEYYVDKFLHN